MGRPAAKWVDDIVKVLSSVGSSLDRHRIVIDGTKGCPYLDDDDDKFLGFYIYYN